MLRRSVFFAIILLQALVTQVHAAEKTALRVSLIPIFDIIPFQAAQTQGYFADQNLTLDGTPSQGGAQGIPALLAGSVQIAFTNVVSVLQGLERGLPLRIIAPAQETIGTPPDSAGLVTLAASGITSGADLSGKRVGVNTRNNIIWLYARSWIDQNGGDSRAVNFVEVPFPQMPDALLNGRIDAAMVSQPYLGDLLQDKAVKALGWPYSAGGLRTATSVYVVTERFAAEHPELISAFVAGLRKGIAWSNENFGSDAYISMVSGYTSIEPEKIKAIVKQARWKFPDVVNVESVRRTMELMIHYGTLKAPIDINAAIIAAR
ncbi:ABC transporter substrate-binding protein [Xanthobacter dioxanivorans]|uniref:ABC transporter substrate-binding protein n=1 Tax=Xanthobacter dioxanivorans TaxID=2528964 RepID=A0A974PP83_9HYPH|nr:ABC transporter substrate-binding protein [Xanthobacter dioxanivorans]QRG06916.1 ABC transporter substrate-binding protein [Xanthobacter dioxanivorans]